ncbi:sterol carrier family protein [Microbacterium aquimaris]|uniref:sterol carrier family protein n=1 Tax=Microbacterium aquimaris TaxID=459816 RepID=UPI002AD448FA|nr:sterol carrier family protein [Microbacterium aquimaris]MDZ8276456.1 sterol carrier family protein [Microbacterium aquimaris]
MARKITTDDGRAALAAVDDAAAAGAQPARADLGTAVRYLLQLLAEKAPGTSVEVRVPPFGAVQVVEGPRHTRGTPPNVVEISPAVWVSLATGKSSWADAVDTPDLGASGIRASEIAALLPLRP